MKLYLKRPIAFFDLETTGIDLSKDRIVEIAVLKIHPDGTEEMKRRLINPEMPIPVESSMIHGIYDEHVKDAPTFKKVAQNFAKFLDNTDLGGYNSNKFDIPVLMEEFLRAGVNFSLDGRKLVDVQNIFHRMEKRTLKAAYKFYCDKDLVNSHSAEADIRATYEVLLKQIERYDGVDTEDNNGNLLTAPVQNDIDALDKFSGIRSAVDFAGCMVYNEEGKEIFAFGKHKGKLVTEILEKEPTYYDWMMKGNFPQYTKKKLEEINIKRLTTKK